MMETTFYDDPLLFSTKEEFKMLKRPVTLDLDSQRPSKKPRYNCLLTSPDLNMLKLASPDLERLIIAQNGLVTTTPTPTQYPVFPKNVTEEQEQYARGFVDALNQLHQSSYPGMGQQPQLHDLDENSLDPATVAVSTNSCSVPMQCPPPPSTSMAVSSHLQPGVSLPSVNHMHHIAPPVTSTGMSSNVMQGGLPNMQPMPTVTTSSGAACYQEAQNNYLQVVVKEEPQTVPSLGMSMTPPLSPIDMEDQERIKLERKRLRNRIAASKCRRRKLERIARLEEKVRMLKGENADLGNTCSKLREQVCQLKQQVMDHVRSGCQIMTTHNF